MKMAHDAQALGALRNVTETIMGACQCAQRHVCQCAQRHVVVTRTATTFTEEVN
jgi:hypothetical protein